MKCIGKLTITCLALTTASAILFSGCGKKEEVVAAYEAENYNKELYTGKLFAEDLCIANGNISMDGAPDPAGTHAIGLFDLEGKKTDFAYNVQERLYPASTTKIMTALLAIENADLEDKVTISANADARTFAADESTCGIKKGDEMTLEDLLNGLLLHSGNDNAVAIAEHVSGSIEEFAKLMNERAESLMATGTHFTNPSGLHDENHYTTAYDLYLIFNECIKHPEFVDIIQSSSYTANIKGADGTLRQETWEPSHFYAQGEAVPPENASIIGGKTGTTKLAGNCLILLEEDQNGKPFISIVMGADTKDLLYQDMTALIEGIPN